MKEQFTREYKKRLRLVLRSKLNGKNKISFSYLTLEQ